MQRENIAKTVGNNIKEARRAAGFTQAEVAQKMGKYQPDYSRYETGDLELDYGKIVFLCKLYNASPNDFFDGLLD